MPSAAGNCSACGGTRAAFLAADCLILASTATAGLAANAWVILAVCKRKSLRTWTNALVLNLAAADVLRCVCDCPALLAVLLLRDAGRGLCDFQMASFSFGCCAQLSTLACIGAERYRAVARPFEVGERRRQIRASVPLTWLSAALVACLCLTYAKDSPVHARCDGWPPPSSSYDTFGIYALFPMWAACLGVIVGFYGRILVLVRAHNRRVFDKGVFPVCQNDKAGEAGGEEPRRAEADPAPTKAPREESGSSADDPGAPSGRKEGAAAEPFHGDQAPAQKSPTQEPATSLHVVAANIQGAVCMMPPTASKERNVKRKESKMAIRTGYIILTFLLFWTPLVTTVLINCMRHGNRNTQVTTPPTPLFFLPPFLPSFPPSFLPSFLPSDVILAVLRSRTPPSRKWRSCACPSPA
ncbi:melanopsin-like isoform 1-T10 [Syngnathus typhle]